MNTFKTVFKTGIIMVMGSLLLAGCSNKSDTHKQAAAAKSTTSSVVNTNRHQTLKEKYAQEDKMQSKASYTAKVSGSAYTNHTDNTKGFRTEHLSKAEAESQAKAESKIQKNHDSHGRKQLKAESSESN